MRVPVDLQARLMELSLGVDIRDAEMRKLMHRFRIDDLGRIAFTEYLRFVSPAPVVEVGGGRAAGESTSGGAGTDVHKTMKVSLLIEQSNNRTV
jgi:hypothetical protein